jgi:predicted ATPase/predicted negative regulator of RcsB-dependent stress response
VHRDLKPSNVLLAEDGTPRLTDFGHAHLATGPRLTQTGTVMGTVLYLSPEACRGETLDAQADIWAFGVMLYEMLSGEVPFCGETFPAVFMAILSQQVPDLSQARSEVPDALVDLVYRMLEKDRGQRIPSVRLVGAELEAIAEGYRLQVEGWQAPSQARPRVSTSRFATPTPPVEATVHNLPAQTTPFVGRENELEGLARLLHDPQARLVTVLGPGGMGKTRLALEAAAACVPKEPGGAFADGVFLVSLAPLRSAANIVPAIGEALNLQFYPGGEPKRQLLSYLHERRMMLLLDNYEHLLDGASLVSEILQGAPQVQVLVTSRERLNLSGENAYVIAGMNFPGWDTPEDALEYSAVKLFMQSARRSTSGFELQADDLRYVARICRLVEGMPLGILLAAAWVEVLSPGEIAAEIAQGYDLLESQVRDVPERHRSVRAVLESSWKMLTNAEREAFARLSVFRGGFTREAGQAVAGVGLRTLMALANKSLLHRDPMGRYEVHELLRQYGQGKLDERPAEKEKALDTHSAYYAEFLQRREADLSRGSLREALSEMDNIRAALRWATRQRKVAEIARCLYSLFYLYQGPGLPREVESVYAAAVDALRARGAEERSEEREAALGLALVLQGFFSTYLGHVDKGRELVQESLSTLRRLGPRREVAIGYSYAPLLIPMDTSEARQLLEESLAISRELDSCPAMLIALWLLGRTSLIQGAHQEAEGYFREALRLSRQVDSHRYAAYALTSLGHMAYERGDYAEARQSYEESLALLKRVGFSWAIGRLHSHLGDVALAVGEYEEARERHREALTAHRDVGVYWVELHPLVGGSWGVLVSLQRLGDVALATGDGRRASEHYRRALEMAIEEPQIELQLHLTLGPARLLAQEGNVERAVELAALARHHPASVEDTKVKAGKFLDELRSELPPDAYAQAEERGRARDMEATVKELLAELGG